MNGQGPYRDSLGEKKKIAEKNNQHRNFVGYAKQYDTTYTERVIFLHTRRNINATIMLRANYTEMVNYVFGSFRRMKIIAKEFEFHIKDE